MVLARSFQDSMVTTGAKRLLACLMAFIFIACQQTPAARAEGTTSNGAQTGAVSTQETSNASGQSTEEDDDKKRQQLAYADKLKKKSWWSKLSKKKKIALILFGMCLVATAITLPIVLSGGGGNHNNIAEQNAWLTFLNSQQQQPDIPQPKAAPPVFTPAPTPPSEEIPR